MAQSPFLNDPSNPLNAEILGLDRQRKLAEMLQQRGMQTPQGQMVSGRFVAPSFTQYLANAFDTYTGAQGQRDVDQKQAELAKGLRAAGATETQDILSTMRGRQPVAEIVPQGQTLLDDQGMPTMGAQRGVAGIAPDMQAAYAKSVGATTPQGQSLAPLLAKQLMREPKFEKIEQYDPKTGNTMVGMIDVNSPNPESTYRPVGVSKPALSQKDIIDFRDRGINVGGGQSNVSMPMNNGLPVANGQQVTGDAKFIPSNLPKYEPDPSLAPAENRKLQAKFSEDLQKSVKNAKSAYGAIGAVSEILRTLDPSSGLAENALTGAREIFGGGGKQSVADAKLKVLEQQLVQQVPRFEGPQSDKDVASYKAAAGDVGNPNIPIASRLGSLQTLVNLNKKYYPNGDWDSINLTMPEVTPNMFGGKNTYFGGKVGSSQSKPNLVYDPATGIIK